MAVLDSDRKKTRASERKHDVFGSGAAEHAHISVTTNLAAATTQ